VAVFLEEAEDGLVHGEVADGETGRKKGGGKK
jgi:hypothetical protein